MKDPSIASQTDPLRGIRGIGPARQKWLQDTLNIVTVEDLAMASWESIEFEVSQDEGITIPRREIQSWIAQAQALNQDAIPDQSPDQASIPPTELATHLDESSLDLPADLSIDLPIASTPIAIVIPDLSLQITQIQINQANVNFYSIVPGQRNVLVLRQHQPVTLEVQFELGLVPGSHEAIAASTYHIQCHAQNRVTDWTTLLETPFSSPLIVDQTRYHSCLPPIQFEIGIYRLQIWVTLQGIRTVGYFEIPLLQIT